MTLLTKLTVILFLFHSIPSQLFTDDLGVLSFIPSTMKVYQIAIAAAAVLSAVEAKGAKRKLIRGVATDEAAEDSQFWERQLGGSARRLAEQPAEDGQFWERQLGGSARRLNEDSEFWQRQLGGSARRLNEDSEFWNRQLGGSARRLAKVEEDVQDDKFWQRELGGSS